MKNLTVVDLPLSVCLSVSLSLSLSFSPPLSLPLSPPLPSPHSEERVMSYYRMMNGLSRGEAVFKYLDIIQSLPMYSMHFFEVKVRL